MLLTVYATGKPIEEVINGRFIQNVESQTLFEQCLGLEFNDKNFQAHWAQYVASLSNFSQIRTNIYKTHMQNFAPGNAFSFAGNFKTVQVVRNPLSMVPSVANHFRKTEDEALTMLLDRNASLRLNINETDLKKTPGHWDFLIGSWASHIQSWLMNTPKNQLLTVKYEDLLANPVEHFSRVLYHLQIPNDRNKLEWAVAQTSFTNLKRTEAERGFVESGPSKDGSFFRSGKNEQFRPSKRQISKIKRKFGALMSKLGYTV